MKKELTEEEKSVIKTAFYEKCIALMAVGVELTKNSIYIQQRFPNYTVLDMRPKGIFDIKEETYVDAEEAISKFIELSRTNIYDKETSRL